MTASPNDIPSCLEEFKNHARWCLWRYKNTGDKETKPPYQAAAPDLYAKPNDPSTWSTYDVAAAAATKTGSGIGLMLSPSGDCFPLVAFDLDDCRDPDTGVAADWALELINEANSYTEITPSGTGFRILGRGGSHQIHTTLPRPDGGHIEIYSQANRYITVSGNHLDGSPETLNKIDDIILRHKVEADGSKQPAQETATKINVSLSDLPVELRSLVERGENKHGERICEGDRSEEFHHAVGWLKDNGWNSNDIASYMKKYPSGIAEKYEGRISPEVRRCFNKCEEKDLPTVIESDDLPKFYSLDELENRPLPMFLVEEVLPAKGVAIIAGPSGVMKSFLMIYIGLIVAGGTDLGVKKVKQAGVIFMINEGEAGMPQRVRATLTHHKIEMPNNFLLSHETPDLMREASIGRFIEAIEGLDYQPGLIIIDTFSKATIGGDDNSTSDMAKAISTAEKLASRFDALVVLIDHEGKDPKKGVRGAYSKYANVDMVGRVRKTSDNVTLTTVKQKEAEDNQTFSFRVNLAKVTHAITGEMREVPALSYREENLSPPAQKDHIVFMLEYNGEISREELCSSFLEAYGMDKKKSFNTQLKRLKDEGKINEENDIVRLVE